MPCNATEILEDACASGINQVDSPTLLYAIIAQNFKDIVGAGNAQEILSEACESGIAQVESSVFTKTIIAQNLCSAADIPTLGTPTNPQYNSDLQEFTFDFTGTNPDHWQFQAQLADNSWVEDFPDASGNMTCAGNERLIGIDTAAIITEYPTNNGCVRVVGKNSDNTDFTNPSVATNCGNPF